MLRIDELLLRSEDLHPLIYRILLFVKGSEERDGLDDINESIDLLIKGDVSHLSGILWTIDPQNFAEDQDMCANSYDELSEALILWSSDKFGSMLETYQNNCTVLCSFPDVILRYLSIMLH